jgi:hypothetical protein
MKNIEIVDGALNSRFEIYAVQDSIFDRLFLEGKDEIYLEDLSQELQDDAEFWNQVYATEIERPAVRGIHGIIHTHPKAKVSILERTAS